MIDGEIRGQITNLGILTHSIIYRELDLLAALIKNAET